MNYQIKTQQLTLSLKELLELRIEWNPGSRIEPKGIEALAADIRENGLVNNLLLGDNFEEGGKSFADGHRRLAALQLIAVQDAKAMVIQNYKDLPEEAFRTKILERALATNIKVDYAPNHCYKKLYTTINNRDLVKPQNGTDNMQSFVLSNFDWDSISGKTSLNSFYRTCAQADARPDATDGTLETIPCSAHILKVTEPSDVAKNLFRALAELGSSNQYVTETYGWQRAITPGKTGSRLAGTSLEDFYRAIRTVSSLPKMREHYRNYITCPENPKPDFLGFEKIVEDLFKEYHRTLK